MPKLVCFDIGNVLISPNCLVLADFLSNQCGIAIDPEHLKRAYFYAINKRGQRLGSSPSISQIVAMRDHIETEFWSHWADALHLTPTDMEAVRNLIAMLERASPPLRLWSQVDRNAHAVLSELKKQRVSIAAVSNTDGDLERDLTLCGIREYFDIICDSEQLGYRKPSRDIFEIALNQANGIDPSEAWFVGDDPLFDIYPSQEIGFGRSIQLNPYEDIPSLPKVCDGRVSLIRSLGELLQQTQKEARECTM